jgi:hypothetical protein
MIRWQQAILLALNGDVDQAKKLLEEYPISARHSDEVSATLTRQLAEAVLHYYQSENGDDRNRKLRTFRQQFVSQDSSVSGSATQPEVVELLLFCSEFLIHDSIKHEDWETLAGDILSNRHATAIFVRQYPGAIPFMRRFCEILVQSAALVYDNSERPRDKQTQGENIALILERMRPIERTVDAAGEERPTLVLFFLPGTTSSTTAESGFVVFYPQDGRTGTLYRLSLTRPMVKQRVPGKALPPLDDELLKQIATEKEAGRRIRVSWNDAAAWANSADALTDTDYPFNDVLPLH